MRERENELEYPEIDRYYVWIYSVYILSRLILSYSTSNLFLDWRSLFLPNAILQVLNYVACGICVLAIRFEFLMNLFFSAWNYKISSWPREIDLNLTDLWFNAIGRARHFFPLFFLLIFFIYQYWLRLLDSYYRSPFGS